MMQSPTNHVIVQVKTKYIKNITTILKMAEIQNASSVSAADCVNIVGEVISAPKMLTKEYLDYSTRDIRPGDVCIFSHEVIYNFLPTAPEEEPVYKNLFTHNGQEYFVCHIRNLYAVVRDGNIRMQNGFVMVEDAQKKSQLYVPQHLKKKISCGSGRLTKKGYPLKNEPELNIEPGDEVYFNPNKLRIYQVNEKPFCILKQSQLIGRKVPEYGELVAVTG